MMQFKKVFLCAAGAALFTVMVTAQTKQAANRMTADNMFATKAAQGGLAEVELGKLAEKNASDAKVKEFGKRMVDDHSKANDELSSIASMKGITLPTSMDSASQALKDRLSKLTGSAFDSAYMQEMVKDHREDVAEFQKESKSGTDTELKQFAASTLPTLQEHLKMAESTSSQVKHER